MLELKAAFLPIAFPTNHDERCHEADYFKVVAQFLGGPDLSVLGFESFTAAGLGIDFFEAVAAVRLGRGL